MCTDHYVISKLIGNWLCNIQIMSYGENVVEKTKKVLFVLFHQEIRTPLTFLYPATSL